MTLAEPQAGGVWRVWDRVPVPTDPTLRRLAVASLISQIGIVVTGGAVRLTGSGLGVRRFRDALTSLWSRPRSWESTASSSSATGCSRSCSARSPRRCCSQSGGRLRSDHPRRDLLVPAFVLLLGIPAQALIGMATVRTLLNPWVVMLHFMCSAGSDRCCRDPRPPGTTPGRDRGPSEIGSPWLRRLAATTLTAAFVAVYTSAPW